jgi:serine/threonine protein kinase
MTDNYLCLKEAGFTEIKPIGRGSYAVVYKALHPTTKIQVALKICKRKEDNVSSTLLREVSFMRELEECPYIAAVQEVYFLAGFVVIQMELQPFDLAMAIRSWRKRGEILTSEQRKFFLKQILWALYYCHKASIVHGDLKPNNILVKSAGLLVLADFGLAIKLKDGIIDNTRNILQTSWYRAPEMFFDPATTQSIPVSNRIDIWSFGAIWYELVVLKPWFCECKNDEEVFAKLKRDTENITEFLEIQFDGLNVEKEERDLIICCLNRNPASRPSVSELLKMPWFKNKTSNSQVVESTSKSSTLQDFVNYSSIKAE